MLVSLTILIYQYQIKDDFFLKEWTETTTLDKCVMANTSATYQQAACTTNQLLNKSHTNKQKLLTRNV